MIKDWKFKNNDARLLISKDFFGIGFLLDFKRPYEIPEVRFSFAFDFFCIRFWWNNYKPFKQ